ASRPENLVGAHSHFDELVPSRPVGRAAAPFQFKRVAEPNITYTFKADRFSIADYLSRNPTTGLLIAKDDTILYEHYQYERTAHAAFAAPSMRKTLPSLLLCIGVSGRKIKSFGDLVSASVPRLATTEYGKTSIRDLLHMSSGVAFVEKYDFNDDIAKLGRDLFGPEKEDPVVSVAQFNTRVAPPGTTWHYAGVETEILGLVLHAA